MRLKVALNAKEASDALGWGWSESVPAGSSVVIDATSRLLLNANPESPILQAAAQSAQLLNSIQSDKETRTLLWIKPRAIRLEEEEAAAPALEK